jgi:hypothetical protein
MQRSDEDVRQLVEKQLRRKVSDGIWNYVKDKLYVEDFQKGGLLDDLLAEIKPLQELAAPVERRPTRAVEAPPLPADRTELELSEATSTYQQALSEVVVAVADLDLDVVAFRGQVLSDKLMAWDEVQAWIEAQQAVEGDPTAWVTFPMPADEDRPVTCGELRDRHGVDTRILKYVQPGENWQVQIGTVAGGTLERLRRLSEALATANAWTPAQATVFVLTGLTPTVSMIRWTEGGHNGRHGRWHAWAERIVLTIDPAVPVDEVAESYRAARERYSKRRTQGEYRIRRQSLRLTRLAGFVARRRPAMKWEDLRRAWNAQCAPDEVYTQGTNFRRDAALAQDRLLYRGLVKPRGRVD